MLLSFRFANHRSFREEQQLNLTPVYPSAVDPAGPDSSVRVVGIFGANASGKSNCLDALSYMRRMATQSDREVEPGLGPARDPFRLSPGSLVEPSRFVVDLLLDGSRHTYGFTLNGERILEEWLYHYPHNRKRTVFDRDEDSFTWGEGSGRRSELERIAEITAPTALFLSTVARFGRSRPAAEAEGPQPLHDVYRWFLHSRARSRPGPGPRSLLEHRWLNHTHSRAVLVDLLRAADVGIVDVRLKPVEPDPLAAGPEDEEYDLNVRRALGQQGRRERQRLQLAHRGVEGDVLFDLEDESTGTQQLLALGLDASVVLRNGGTMTVDEIDASLHPVLTAKLIGLFQSSTTNPLHSQLIFTSHDAALLGTFDAEEILHRDEIWFVEKDDEGASVLYPLTDFKPRKEGENRQRRYLNGSYGAIPDLSTALFERALASRGGVDDTTTE